MSAGRKAGRAVALAAVGVLAHSALCAAGGRSDLAVAIDRVVERTELVRASWGIEVVDVRTGRVLYSKDPTRNLRPASTLKLLTTAAALDTFGAEHRFRTTVETAATIDASGRLDGDVYLVGRGDANLAARSADGRTGLETLADALVASGVRGIAGRVIGRDDLFQGERRGDDWSWEDLVWCYGAEVAALSYADNCVLVTATPGARAGDPVRVEVDPPTRYVDVRSSAVTTATGTDADLTLERDFGTNVIRLSGERSAGRHAAKLFVAVENPLRYTATVFAELLASRGVSVAGGAATDPAPSRADLRVLASHDGPPMAEVIRAVNKPSQNLHTEILLRALGAKATGQGTVETGVEALGSFLSKAGVDTPLIALHDGSGLSRSNLVSAHDLVRVLLFMASHPLAAAFRDSLPVAGRDGTLEHRLSNAASRGRIIAKTGSLRAVASLAGYAKTARGEERAFAIVLNNAPVDARAATAAVDAIAAAIVAR